MSEEMKQLRERYRMFCVLVAVQEDERHRMFCVLVAVQEDEHYNILSVVLYGCGTSMSR